MKDFDLTGFMQNLTESDPRLLLIGMIAIAVLLAVVVIYILVKYLGSKETPFAKDASSKITPKAPTPPIFEEEEEAYEAAPTSALFEDEAFAEPAPAAVVEETFAEPAPVFIADEPVAMPPKAPTPAAPVKPLITTAALSHIPQESVLRRHMMTHIRYMLETVNAPRPTESVLRRHYEQLISSQLEDCVQDPARFKRLLSDYDDYRKAAFQAA